MRSINENIKYDVNLHNHLKASETYVEVHFRYPEGREVKSWIPIEYRRTGLFLKNLDEIESYLENIYPLLDPIHKEKWIEDQEFYWLSEKSNASETKKIFDIISSGEWVCIGCSVDNSNWARRYQDIKEFGYTFSTKTPVNCNKCNKKTTYVQAVFLPRYHTIASGNAYEVFSPKLRKKIITLLGSYDVYEAKVSNNLLPDHKFPEIRWDKDTKDTNPMNMEDDEIRKKFQLLNNQRNLQKREICRKCYQTGERGIAYGIDYFYAGSRQWENKVPPVGKNAEKGCVGCAWYDFEEWRNSLLMLINN
jgi:hypothetical protein